MISTFKYSFFKAQVGARGIIVQSVIIGEIAERKAITKQHSIPCSTVNGLAVFLIQLVQLFYVSRSVFLIYAAINLVCPAQLLGYIDKRMQRF